MKKILFLFTILSVFFTSCSSSDDLSTTNNTETKYPVSFKIANPLAVNNTPFKTKSTEDVGLGLIEVRVFDTKGDQLMDFVLGKRNQSEWLQPDGTALFKLSLPKGNYIISFYTVMDPSFYLYETPILSSYPFNYFEFYVPNEGTKGYYESIKIAVTPTNDPIEKEVELQPMWSNLNITLEDAQTFDVPNGTDALKFDVSPLYIGFNLETKLSTEKAPDDFISDFNKSRTNILSLDSIRANPTYKYLAYIFQTLPENGNLAIKVNYLKTKGTTEPIVLETRDLQIPDITIENGYNYNINGNLGSKNSGQSMNISLGEFNKEDVNINF